MLVPTNLFTVHEYDVTFLVTPSARSRHQSDTVLATIEMLVEHDGSSETALPFVVLSEEQLVGAHPATGAISVVNGNRQVEMSEGAIDEIEFGSIAVQRMQTLREPCPDGLEAVRVWAKTAAARTERAFLGTTRIAPNEERMIVAQYRFSVPRQDDGRYIIDTIAPPPVTTLGKDARVSVAVILPWSVRYGQATVVEATQGFRLQRGMLKTRRWIAWQWEDEPAMRLAYRYE